MDNWLALFDGQTRYFLDIFDSPVKPDVLRFRGREALSEPFRWDIEFTTPQANIPPEQVLMKYATFRMRSGKSFHGRVTLLEWLSTSKDQSHYRLTLSSRLALLGYTRQCAVFQNQSVPEVVEQVLRRHGLEGPDFEFRLARTYPPREIITQWRETDLEFIRRILSEVGIYWRTEMDDVRGLDTYIFADSQLNYRFDVRLPYSEPSGLFDGAAESVWDVRTWHRVATGTVATRDYNYRTASTPMDATVSVRNDAVTTGEYYRYAAPYRDAGDDTSPEPETESGAFYARIHHERELNKSARIHLFSNAAHLTPGHPRCTHGLYTTCKRWTKAQVSRRTFLLSARWKCLKPDLWGRQNLRFLRYPHTLLFITLRPVHLRVWPYETLLYRSVIWSAVTHQPAGACRYR